MRNHDLRNHLPGFVRFQFLIPQFLCGDFFNSIGQQPTICLAARASASATCRHGPRDRLPLVKDVRAERLSPRAPAPRPRRRVSPVSCWPVLGAATTATGKNRIMIYGPKDDGSYPSSSGPPRRWRSRSPAARRT